MQVIVTNSYAESCEKVAERIIAQVNKDAASKLGLATGGSVEPVYELLVAACKAGKVSFKDISTVNLDEYVGMPPDSPLSYRKFMNDWLFDQVDVDKSRTYVVPGLGDMDKNLAQFQEAIVRERPIDLQLLGVGVSGHIGFNEPGDFLTAVAHVEQLNQSTIQSNSRYFTSEDDVPKQAFTMGVGDIMKAKSIVLIATGNKVEAMRRLLVDDQVTTQVPVTVLKMHPDATIIIDRELAEKAGYIA